MQGCLCVITEFLSFVPLLLVDKLMLDSGAAAMYASAYTAGTDSLAKSAALSAHDSLAKLQHSQPMTR